MYIYMYICAHWGISLPSKTPALPLFCQAPHKSENCQSPSPLPILFSQFVHLYFGFLQSSLKSNFSVNSIILKIFHP